MTSTLRWFKSSYSNDSGGQCLETAYTWRKSSYSNDSGGDCVDVATCLSTIHVRDSKIPDGPHLSVSSAAWTSFVTGARRA
ncbi:DUF397 domain-containing protein [Streptomyces sp. NPDC047024]|uniref:DUF397 domain-containing protein n=1 Tax=Streptomyces sp. NPDC047024 TaxID=3155476 RepID=UPI0033DE613B